MPANLLLEKSLQCDIDKICDTVLEMSQRAEHALNAAFEALKRLDRKQAYTIILRDRFIDELDNQLDRLCLQFFIRHQPVAGHLRFVFATIKIVRDLERIGDYAGNIARQVVFLSSIDPLPPNEKYIEKFTELAQLSIPMLRTATRAFVEKDSLLARETMEIEGKADIVRANINNELMTLQQRGEIPLEALTPLLTIARRYERVTDQAKNICEEVVYMATGEVLKHQHTDIFRILFVDEDNSCFSQIAEGIAKAMNLTKFSFNSAGFLQSKPVNPDVAKFLHEKGIDISRQHSKFIDKVSGLEHIEMIISLFSEKEEQFKPAVLKTLKLNWPVQNYCKMDDTGTLNSENLEKTFNYLKNHITDLVQAIIGEKNNANNQ